MQKCSVTSVHKLYDNFTKLYNKKCSVDNYHPTSMQRRSFLQVAFWVKEKRKALPFGQAVGTFTSTKVISTTCSLNEFWWAGLITVLLWFDHHHHQPDIKIHLPQVIGHFFLCMLPTSRAFHLSTQCLGVFFQSHGLYNFRQTKFKDFLRTFRGQMTVFKV